MKEAIDAYDAFAATSGDALEYACRTLTHLAELAENVRVAAGLKAPPPIIRPLPGTFRITRQTF